MAVVSWEEEECLKDESKALEENNEWELTKAGITVEDGDRTNGAEENWMKDDKDI